MIKERRSKSPGFSFQAGASSPIIEIGLRVVFVSNFTRADSVYGLGAENLGEFMQHPIKRQAVVIIHGIGEQRPMETLRSFAEAIPKVEQTESKGVGWSKPDGISEGFEHHRFTLPSTRTRPVTDVYELYWAHLFEQSNPSTFLAWVKRLLFRPLPELPRRFQLVSVLLWLLLIVLVGGGYWAWQTYAADRWVYLIAALPLVGAVYGVIMYAANAFMLGTISDAARYLDANPRNVEARNKVRELGVTFLERLHKSDRNYDRIIVCSHSLGTVIGYDILQHLWYRMHEHHTPVAAPRQKVQKQMSRYSAQRDGKRARALQRDLWLEQIGMGNRWRITDFVTMGSPLTHADVSMSDSDTRFHQSIKDGELPACPPSVDPQTKRIGFQRKYTIAGGQKRTIYLLRHSSMFAVTRWTNIYFETLMGLFGDPIGGPMGRRFGSGVHDIKIKPRGRHKLFAHLRYWAGPALERGVQVEDGTLPQTALEALREALDIDRKVIVSGEDVPEEL